MSTPDSVQPEPPAEKPRRRGPLLVVGLLAVVVFLVIIASCTAGSGSSRAANPELMRLEAISHCEDRVRDELRSPSTAEFNSEARMSGGAWRVEGSVDAQNGFGATVRADFSCEATISGGSVTSQLVSLDQR